MLRCARLRSMAERFEREVSALVLASRDARVAWPSRLVVLLVLLYVISPIDLVPESAHVLGAVDDLIVLSLGLFVAVRLVPTDVMAECREVRRCATIARAALVGRRSDRPRLAGDHPSADDLVVSGVLCVSVWVGRQATVRKRHLVQRLQKTR
jgi:uncharacterized membrane protein YkvA (DUF1232 family)